MSYLKHHFDSKQRTMSTASKYHQKTQHFDVDQSYNMFNRLSDRIDSIDLKLNSLVNLIHLFQKYTQIKDQQQEKQKQENLYNKDRSEAVDMVERMERIEHSIDIVYHKIDELINHQEGNQLNCISNNNPEQTQSFLCTNIIPQNQSSIRYEFNQKIQVCILNCQLFIKQTKNQHQENSDRIDQIVFVLNKVENQSLRSKMIFQNQIEGIKKIIEGISKVKEKNTSISKEYFDIFSETTKKVDKRTKSLKKSQRKLKGKASKKQGKCEHLINVASICLKKKRVIKN